MSTSYHISYSSLLLKAPAGPEKSLSVLVLCFKKLSKNDFHALEVTVSILVSLGPIIQ